MFQIYISNAVFAQSAKYLIIAKNDIQTKRSDVCLLWTSAPTFNQPILVDTLDHLFIKCCIATTDRKLSVIGSFQVQANELNNNAQIIYEQERKFEQIIEDKQVCIGRCLLTIKRSLKKQQEQISKKQIELDQDLELKSEEDQKQINTQLNNEKCQLIFMIHCGFNFYLNQSFRVCVNWCGQKKQTKSINNKIAPFWGEYIKLKGKQQKSVEIQVRDSKNNKLQWMKIDPKFIRIMFPYHLNIQFRDECVNAYPQVFFTILRQDVPLFSTIDRQINLTIRHLGPAMPNRHHEYLLIYRKQVQDEDDSKLPVFIKLDMKNYISFDKINKLVQKSSNKDYQWNHWNILLPIKSEYDVKNKQQISLLKSILTKPLCCLYFCLEEPKLLFEKNLWNGVKIIQKKQKFQNILKDIYYNQKKILLGKTIQILKTCKELEQNEHEAVSDEDKWRILSQNYVLRQKMLTSSSQSIANFKSHIKSKGQTLKDLKKILNEVRKMNKIMIQKQKSAFVPNKNQKVRENYQNYDLVEIITNLFAKHEQLQQRKSINDQMRMRMNTLQHFNQDTEQIDKLLLQNSEKLLQQQKLIKEMNLIKKTLPKQRQVLRRLQKIFQEREIDREFNDLLKKQHDKLNSMHKHKQANLENIYNIIKQRNSGQNKLLHAISVAEQQLIKLNTEYVKLKNYS